MLIPATEFEYNPLRSVIDDQYGEESETYPAKKSNGRHNMIRMLCLMLSLIAAFVTGAVFTLYINPTTSKHSYQSKSIEGINTAPHIPLAPVVGNFLQKSPFSKEPPQEGNVSEPIWDALIPNGLGYFAPLTTITSEPNSSVVIPSVFHQLHCLYLLRRAYYTDSPESELQRFDFGRNRSVHVAHCFDYLTQAITCSSDSTLEPAMDKEHGFLGSGFARRCWDFESLKAVVEDRRVFDATGFLAWGIGKDGKVELEN